MVTRPIKIPSQEILNRIQDELEYDPETGWLIWANPSNNHFKPGRRAGGPFTINGYTRRRIGFWYEGKSLNILEHHAIWYWGYTYY